MRRNIIFTALLVGGMYASLSAQERLHNGVWEYQGTIFYQYANSSAPATNGTTFDLYSKQHTIDVQPSIGYFINDQWEVSILPLVSFSSLNYNYSGYVFTNDTAGPQVVEASVIYKNMDLGLSAGIFFHIPVSDKLTSFVGTTTGISWQRSTSDFNFPTFPLGSYGGTWSKPTFIYPTLDLGLKAFITDSWAVVPRVRMAYESLAADPTFNAFNYDKKFSISFGVGFAVYLE